MAPPAPARSARPTAPTGSTVAIVGLLLGCLFLLIATAVGGAGIWWWWSTNGRGPRVLSGSPTPTRTASVPSDLEGLAGTWVVDPQDANHDPDDPDSNQADFRFEGGRLVARPSRGDGGEIRLTRRQGNDLTGEYAEGTTVKPLTGRVEGDRLILTVEGDSVTLVRAGAVAARPPRPADAERGPEQEPGWAPDPPEPQPPAGHPLFEDRGDVDGDGVEERVLVVSETEAGSADPTAAAPRRLVVVEPDGTVAFRTDPFQEPFRPDLDDLADGPANEAGVHVVAGSGSYADIRLVFAPASGNYVVFRYDGATYAPVESGD